MRCFLAVDLPAELKKVLGKWLKGLDSRVSGVRWVGPEQMHLTLRFLGDVDPDTLEEVQRRAAAVTAESAPGQLQATGTGVFRNLRQPRIAWIGVEGDLEPLTQLYTRLETALTGLDIAEESSKTPFHPHITVGRIRHPKKALGLEHFIMAGKDKHFGDFPLEALTLYKSELTREGARYTSLARFELGD